MNVQSTESVMSKAEVPVDVRSFLWFSERPLHPAVCCKSVGAAVSLRGLFLCYGSESATGALTTDHSSKHLHLSQSRLQHRTLGSLHKNTPAAALTLQREF